MHGLKISPSQALHWLALFVLATALLFLAAGCGGEGVSKGLDTSEMVYGSPESQLTMEKPATSKLYEGSALSFAPDAGRVPNARVHEVRLDVTHSLVEVTEGVSFMAWTFGGTLPGPVLRVRQGDKVTFTETNRSDQTILLSPPMPHSIDFHAAMVSPSDKYREVIPGGTIKFEWTANYPGVFMYHCGTPAILQHMIYGMVGMTIVEPKEGYPTKVDREFVLIQNELYLTKMKDGTYLVDMEAARKKNATYVTFNGKPSQYVQNPLKAKAGERVRMYILNTGPSGTSSFHVVGTLFDRVWVDGNPQNEMRGMQTVLLGSSSGAIVEFMMPEAGTYTFVDHEFADVELGAVGQIVAEPDVVAKK
ncbi:MAG: multicopper oxidase domain-containing protein [candidate division Zixibacteria bacterium]|nr:multicopper oxidase domain-containing protein [candidate division Zixibacteria bacterium]